MHIKNLLTPSNEKGRNRLSEFRAMLVFTLISCYMGLLLVIRFPYSKENISTKTNTACGKTWEEKKNRIALYSMHAENMRIPQIHYRQGAVTNFELLSFSNYSMWKTWEGKKLSVHLHLCFPYIYLYALVNKSSNKL